MLVKFNITNSVVILSGGIMRVDCIDKVEMVQRGTVLLVNENYYA